MNYILTLTKDFNINNMRDSVLNEGCNDLKTNRICRCYDNLRNETFETVQSHIAAFFYTGALLHVGFLYL